MSIFRIINKNDNKIIQKRKASEVSIYFLGRRISAYMVIKSDETGDRLVNLDPAKGDVSVIEQILEAA